MEIMTRIMIMIHDSQRLVFSLPRSDILYLCVFSCTGERALVRSLVVTQVENVIFYFWAESGRHVLVPTFPEVTQIVMHLRA